MDVINPSSQHQATAASAPAHQPAPTSKQKRVTGRGMRILSVVLLICAALIIGLVALYLAIGGNSNEDKYVDKTKFQAVFLNGGQVYFGKIHTLNDKYITIDNIYYLRVNSQTATGTTATTAASQDVSLAKLGCELHGPTDAMVINQDQVLFWENLKADGQVVKAITAYVKANPNGQTCDTTATTPTTTDTTKK